MKTADQGILWRGLCVLQRDSAVTLQAQIRQAVIQAIHERRLLPDAAMPSTRTLADALEVSRNTVVQAYERLVDDGYLSSEASSGHRIQARAYADAALPATAPSTHVPNDAAADATPDWAARMGPGTSAFRYVRKPIDWQRYPYPFVFGQFDPTLFRLPTGARPVHWRCAGWQCATGPATASTATTRRWSSRSRAAC